MQKITSRLALALFLGACGGGNGADAGMDAARVDAGRIDAGDAGTIDAGPPDTGIDAGRPDWLGGWLYRVPVTTNNAGGALDDLQLRVRIDTILLIGEGKLRADHADFRVTDADGTTPLPFWVEPAVAGTATGVWFRVPVLNAGTQTFYVYYGNPAAASAASGDATFLFFDDFQTLDTSRWTVHMGDQGAVAAVGGELRLSATVGTTQNAASVIGPAFDGEIVLAAQLNQLDADGSTSYADVMLRSTSSGPYGSGTWGTTRYAAEVPNLLGQISTSAGLAGMSSSAPIDAQFSRRILYTNRLGELIESSYGAGPTYIWGIHTQLAEGWSASSARYICLSANAYNGAPAFDYRFDWVLVAKRIAIVQPTVRGSEQML